MSKKKEVQQRRQFEKNWNQVKKTGGPIYYEKKVIERGKTPFVDLSISVVKGSKSQKPHVRIVLERTPITGYVAMASTCEANLPAIVQALQKMNHSESIVLAAKNKTPSKVVLVAQILLDNAIEMFNSIKESKDSTLTIRLDREQSEKIKTAGRRIGLRVSTKILIFCLMYYLVMTAEDQDAPAEDPKSEDPPSGED